jgi:hypothetical protein
MPNALDDFFARRPDEWQKVPKEALETKVHVAVKGFGEDNVPIIAYVGIADLMRIVPPTTAFLKDANTPYLLGNRPDFDVILVYVDPKWIPAQLQTAELPYSTILTFAAQKDRGIAHFLDVELRVEEPEMVNKRARNSLTQYFASTKSFKPTGYETPSLLRSEVVVFERLIREHADWIDEAALFHVSFENGVEGYGLAISTDRYEDEKAKQLTSLLSGVKTPFGIMVIDDFENTFGRVRDSFPTMRKVARDWKFTWPAGTVIGATPDL